MFRNISASDWGGSPNVWADWAGGLGCRADGLASARADGWTGGHGQLSSYVGVILALSRPYLTSFRGAQHDVSSRNRGFRRRFPLIALTVPASSGTK